MHGLRVELDADVEEGIGKMRWIEIYNCFDFFQI